MRLDQSSVEELAALALERFAPSFELHLDFDRERFRVVTNDEPLADALADYFSEFTAAPAPAPEVTIYALEADGLALPEDLELVAPDPGKLRPKEATKELRDGRLVHKVRTGMVFAFSDQLHVALGPARANANQVVNFVNNRQIQRRLLAGDLLAHAACVAVDGRGIGIAGFAGAGKSTTALAVMTALPQARFVSNDRLLLGREDGALRARGVAKHPRINPGTALHNPALRHIVTPAERQRFEALVPAELWALEHKYDALIPECYGPGRFVMGAQLAAFCVLDWRPGGGPASLAWTTFQAHPELLAAVIKSPGVFFRRPAGWDPPGPSAYADYFRELPVLRGSGGPDFAAIVPELARALQSRP